VQLHTAASTVENLLRNGENKVSKEQLDVLEREMKAVLDELAPLLTEYEEMLKIKITDRTQIRRIFEDLEPLLKSKNPECEDLLDDLYRIDGAEKLAVKVENFRFDQAMEELNKIKFEFFE